MDQIKENIVKAFGNKLRVRVCGVCIENGRVLMVNHHSLNEGGDFWGPPGGGMDFGTSAEDNLKREFSEETGLNIEIERFLFVHEYLNTPLHAIELIFKVKRKNGTLKTGYDPEMAKDKQIIKAVRFMSFKELIGTDKNSIHQLFLNVRNITELNESKGYFLWKK